MPSQLLPGSISGSWGHRQKRPRVVPWPIRHRHAENRPLAVAGIRHLLQLLAFRSDPMATVCHEDEHVEEMLKRREQGPTWPMHIAENAFATITFLEDALRAEDWRIAEQDGMLVDRRRPLRGDVLGSLAVQLRLRGLAAHSSTTCGVALGSSLCGRSRSRVEIDICAAYGAPERAQGV
eukprot:s1046_g10.t2